jgi:DNA repair exonuclease SbcCD ATPase subunit
LRERLNEFLSGAKKRMKRTQIRIRLNREKRRKSELVKDLGRAAWTAKIPEEKYQPYIRHLDHLEQQGAERQAELKSVLSLILELQKRQDEARQTKKRLLNLKEGGQHPDNHELAAAREQEKSLKKEIKDGEGKIRAGQQALKAIDRQKADEFLRLGMLIDEGRPEQKEFLGHYVQIDKLNRKILHYINEIEKFR